MGRPFTGHRWSLCREKISYLIYCLSATVSTVSQYQQSWIGQCANTCYLFGVCCLTALLELRVWVRGWCPVNLPFYYLPPGSPVVLHGTGPDAKTSLAVPSAWTRAERLRWDVSARAIQGAPRWEDFIRPWSMVRHEVWHRGRETWDIGQGRYTPPNWTSTPTGRSPTQLTDTGLPNPSPDQHVEYLISLYLRRAILRPTWDWGAPALCQLAKWPLGSGGGDR